VHYEIRYKPAFSSLVLTLRPGERILAEAGAMASRSAALNQTTQLFGGLIPALLKHWFGGESLFVNQFVNPSQSPQDLVLTQSTLGDMQVLHLEGNAICLQPGAYIAHTSGVSVDLDWAGFSSWFSGEGLFKLKLSGKGLVFFGAYGGISTVAIRDEFVVDTGHLVAYEPSISMKIGLAGGLLGSMKSGEGFINRLSGRGTIYLQSRSVDGLARFLKPKLR